MLHEHVIIIMLILIQPHEMFSSLVRVKLPKLTVPKPHIFDELGSSGGSIRKTFNHSFSISLPLEALESVSLSTEYGETQMGTTLCFCQTKT